MIKNILIGTDLDRTLIPNGVQEYDGSMDIFKRILKQRNFKLAFATGRNLRLVKEAMNEYDLPFPDYAITEVGTKLYYRKGSDFVIDKGWSDKISKLTNNWDINKFKANLSE
ncbi:MAG: HAD family hydrolase, partial [Nanobdellota archaeon]